jgi:hypothetical protein
MKRLLCLVALALAACTDDEGARRSLESQGFTDVQIGGYDAWSCGNDDTTATKFTAKNQAGKRVSGTVCCGLWAKGCTVRW